MNMKYSVLLILSLAISFAESACGTQGAQSTIQPSPPQVQLSAQTLPSSGDAGTTMVAVTAIGFPVGTLGKDYITVWLTPSCGGAGSTTTVPTALIANPSVGSYEIQFTVPQYLLTNTYYVTITGATEQGASFTSANCAEIAVTGTLPTPIVNVVTQYGADPTGKSDDAAAITHAIAQAQANGGGTVYFPAGTYLVGAGLTPGKAAGLPIISGNPITLADIERISRLKKLLANNGDI